MWSYTIIETGVYIVTNYLLSMYRAYFISYIMYVCESIAACLIINDTAAVVVAIAVAVIVAVVAVAAAAAAAAVLSLRVCCTYYCASLSCSRIRKWDCVRNFDFFLTRKVIVSCFSWRACTPTV